MNQPRPTQESFIVRGIVVTNVGVAAKGLKGKELIFEINECPYLYIAIKAEPTFKEDL